MSPRVDALMTHYAALSDELQSMFRDLVALAWLRVERQQLAERLAASVPFKISAGVRASFPSFGHWLRVVVWLAGLDLYADLSRSCWEYPWCAKSQVTATRV